MNRLLNPTSEIDWQDGLRQAALNARSESVYRMWPIWLAVGATVVFIATLVASPGWLALPSHVLDQVYQVVEENRVRAEGLPADGLTPLLYPVWLLLLSRFMELALVARLLSGLSAVLTLFLAYQLCHGLSHQEQADEQSCFALLALALSPAFFLSAAGGGSEMTHLALLLWALLCVQRAPGAAPLRSMALAGLLVGVSLLIRPISLLVPPAVLLWVVASRPFDSDEPGSNTRPALGFLGGFLLGASPQVVVTIFERLVPFPWGPAELGMLWARLTSEPLGVLTGTGGALVQYVAADDFERLSAVNGSIEIGAWGSVLAGIIALTPTLLKVLGLVGLLSLCVLDRFERSIERARLLAILTVFFAVGGSIGLVDERSLLPIGTLLVVAAFAGLPNLLPDAVGGMIGLALVVLMVLHQIGVGAPAYLASTYRTTDEVAMQLRMAGAAPNQVMSSSWSFYDTRSPWKERYRHIPAYVHSVEGLRDEMRQQGVSYLVFDRQTGAGHWPRLVSLLEAERPQPGFRSLGPAMRTNEMPSNMIAIYKLE